MNLVMPFKMLLQNLVIKKKVNKQNNHNYSKLKTVFFRVVFQV